MSAENPVRVIDAFVDELDLVALGFEGAAATGRPSYHPVTLLKLQRVLRTECRPSCGRMCPSRPYAHPTDTTEEEWAFVAPYLALLPDDAGQRRHALRAVFDALRWLLRAGAPWRLLPGDFPLWHAVYDQAQRWLAAGVFEAMVHDLRAVLRLAQGRPPAPSAAVLDARTLQSTPESGHRAGYDGAKRERGSKVHLAVDTLGHLLALHVTPATANERAEVGRLAEAVQAATGASVTLAHVDQGYTGPRAEQAAAQHGIRLEVVRLPGAKRGFVLLPRRWVVERSFAWAARFRRLARDDGRRPTTLAGLHLPAFVTLMLPRTIAAFDLVRNTLYLYG